MAHLVHYGQGTLDGQGDHSEHRPLSGPVNVPAILLGGSGKSTVSVAGSVAGNVLVGGPDSDVLTGAPAARA